MIWYQLNWFCDCSNSFHLFCGVSKQMSGCPPWTDWYYWLTSFQAFRRFYLPTSYHSTPHFSTLLLSQHLWFHYSNCSCVTEISSESYYYSFPCSCSHFASSTVELIDTSSCSATTYYWQRSQTTSKSSFCASTLQSAPHSSHTPIFLWPTN